MQDTDDDRMQLPIVAYADDILLLTRPRSLHLATLTAVVEMYCARWRLRLNPAKSVIVAVGKRAAVPAPSIMDPLIGRVGLQWTRTMKYLGVTISHSGSLASSTRDRVRKTKMAAGAIRSRLFAGRLPLGTITLLRVVYPLIWSHLSYPAQVVSPSRAQVEACDKMRRALMRTLLGIPPSGSCIPDILLQGELGWEPLQAFLDRLRLNFLGKHLPSAVMGQGCGSSPTIRQTASVDELIVEESFPHQLMVLMMSDPAYADCPWRCSTEEAVFRCGQSPRRVIDSLGDLEWPASSGICTRGSLCCNRDVKLLVNSCYQDAWRRSLDLKCRSDSLGGKMAQHFLKGRAWECMPTYRLSNSVAFNSMSHDIAATFFQLKCNCLPTLLSYRCPLAIRLRKLTIHGKEWLPRQLGSSCVFCKALGCGNHEDNSIHLLSGNCALLSDLFAPFSAALLDGLKCFHWRKRPGDDDHPLAVRRREPVHSRHLIGACIGRHMHHLIRRAFHLGPVPLLWELLTSGEEHPFFRHWFPAASSRFSVLRSHKYPAVVSQLVVKHLVREACKRREAVLGRWIVEGNLSTLQAGDLSAADSAWLFQYVQGHFPGALRPVIF